ncbi:MAG: SocA family protein [Candidatus Symbiothrix sp.]|jgi:uncharacterized phage-associated protein|nr:SocA family protein [Candidatus Symbiothrix sp.]
MRINKNLIGNIIILLAERCKPLYHTKLLKILYLIDEEATKRTGAPITWLSYNVWQYGPVSEDVYFSKIEGVNKFSEFVKFEHLTGEKYIIRPVADFNDSEFSELDLQIIEDVIREYGHLNAKQLVDIVHSKDSLWEKTKRTVGIQFSGQNKTSPVALNFAELLGDDGFKKTVYYNTLENMELQSTLYDL